MNAGVIRLTVWPRDRWLSALLSNAARLAAACLLALPQGCGDHDRTEERTYSLSVVDENGRPIPTFVVTTKSSGNEFRSFVCGSGAAATPDATCTNTGLVFKASSGTVTATIKARGYSFWHGVLGESCSDHACRSGLEIRLAPLPAFEHTADYDTGFDVDTGRDQFEQAAVSEQTELGAIEVVKFYIADIQATPRVYFQHTKQHPLHYTFARDVLKQPGSLTQFENATYHGIDRKAIAGTLLFRPNVHVESAALGSWLTAPVSVTFFPSDDLTPEQALVAHRLLEERIGFAPLYGGETRVVYEPAGSAQETALANATRSFAEWGSLWLTLGEVYGSLSEQLLNPGVAYGTLKVASPETLATDVVSYRDILVLTRLPLELPIVGGTITEEMQTPLAHVNIAARTRGTPNIALKKASSDPRIADHLGKLVRFEVSGGSFSITEATLDEAEQFWKSRARAPFSPTFDDTTDRLLPFAEIGFADATRVGVKAANLAELSHILGNQSPEGFAVPFYFYRQFMRTSLVTPELCAAALADCPKSGRTQTACSSSNALCSSAIDPRLSLFDYVTKLLGDTQFGADSVLREATLAGLQYMIRHAPVASSFATMLDTMVTDRFGAAKVRIRSSTNAEDLDNFSGAGLYDSVGVVQTSGEVASQEIRKVWASVWNWRAFEERSYWNIDHLAVRMGSAVHRAFTDEAANGVLITQNIAEPTIAGMYVNVQRGEVSVTNPTNGALPEVFSIIAAPTGVQAQRQRFSSLSPNEAILTDQEIASLYATCDLIQTHFAELYQKSPYSLALDIEFKFNQPDRALVIKQVRPYTDNTTP
jgi:hypothetical protein